jgi:hypothetical protein
MLFFGEKKSALRIVLLMSLTEYCGNTPWAPAHHQRLTHSSEQPRIAFSPNIFASLMCLKGQSVFMFSI